MRRPLLPAVGLILGPGPMGFGNFLPEKQNVVNQRIIKSSNLWSYNAFIQLLSHESTVWPVYKVK